MATLLLDTHALLWMVSAPERLGPKAAASIADADADVLASAATVWEIAIKSAIGKLTVPDDLWSEVERSGVDLFAIEPGDAMVAGALPLHHRDPFDRLLIAQAQRLDAQLVTVDPLFRRYDVRVMGADI